MKICIISDFCYPSFSGGSSKHVFDIISGFEHENIDVSLQTRKKCDANVYSANDLNAEKLYSKWLKQGKIKEFSTLQIFNIFSYYKKIKNADNVILEHPIMGMFGGVMARIMGKQIIYHYHGPIHLEYANKIGKKGGAKYHLLWLMQKITTAISSKIIFHSNYMKNKAVEEHSVILDKCYILPPYIEGKENIADVKLPCQIDPGRINILIPRRLTARTGVVEFLTKFNSISDSLSSRFMIYITGVGELEAKVKELANQNPTNVQYIGFVSYDQLWLLYSQMNAVAVPTLDLEGFGYVILEALSCGAGAIVSTTCGGGYDFVKEQLSDKYCFDVNSADSIKTVLEYIASLPQSQQQYIEIADKFSKVSMLDVYINDLLK